MGKWHNGAQIVRETMTQAGAMLTDEQAATVPTLYEKWAPGISYKVGDRVRYNGVLFRCLIAHTSSDEWKPETAVSLWAVVLIPDPEVIPEWVQPESTNPYQEGDKVMHNGKVWVSEYDNNTWEPGVFGWAEVTA